MTIQEIPLTADNQQFTSSWVVLPGGLASYGAICTGYGPAERQRGAGNLRYSSRHCADLLAQYACMGLGFKLVVVSMTTHRIIPRKLIWAASVIYGINGVSMSQNWMRHFELQLVTGTVRELS